MEDSEKHKKHEKHMYIEHEQHKKHQTYKTATWTLGIVSVVLLILFIASISTGGFSGGSPGTTVSGKTLSPADIKTKTQAYISNLVQGQSVSVDSITDEGNIYAMNLTVAGKQYNSYATKDGKLLFPQAIDMTQAQAASTPAAAAAPTVVPKTDKPKVELFVMAYCPYGTQAEKGILPAVRALGSKVDFSVKFVDYSMHESFAPEVEENLRQYCIQKNQPDVYLKYLACFLNASSAQGLNTNTTLCQQQTGVDVNAMNTCYAATDAQYNITALKNDKSTWLSGQFPQFNIQQDLNQQYGVQGSPTLVINGVQSNAGRDPASFLAGICAAFNNAPAECQTQLSSTSPGPGFGYDSVGAATAAGCGV